MFAEVLGSQYADHASINLRRFSSASFRGILAGATAVRLYRFTAFHHMKLYSGGGRTGRRNVHRTQQEVLKVECD
jgi:hypothetical protein